MASAAEVEKARAAKKKRRAELKKQDDLDLIEAQSTPALRRVMARIVYGLCGLKSVGFNVDPHLRDLHAGQRAVGAALERELQRVDVDAWERMETERNRAIAIEPVEPTLDPDDEDD